MLGSSFNYRGTQSEFSGIYRLFLEDHDVDVRFPHESYWGLPSSYTGAPSSIIPLIHSLYPSYESVPVQHRLDNALSLSSHPTVDAFKIALGCSELGTEIVQMKTFDEQPRTVLCFAASEIAYRLMMSRKLPQASPTHRDSDLELQQWRDLFQEAVQLGADLYPTDVEGQTPMEVFLRTFSHPYSIAEDVLADCEDLFGIRAWAGLLFECKVDLLSYGAQAKSGLDAGTLYLSKYARQKPKDRPFKYVELSFGPQPSDWQLVVHRLIRIGTFRQVVVPGSWPSDHTKLMNVWEVQWSGSYSEVRLPDFDDERKWWKPLREIDHGQWELVDWFEIAAKSLVDQDLYRLGSARRKWMDTRANPYSHDDTEVDNAASTRGREEAPTMRVRSRSTQGTSFSRLSRPLLVPVYPTLWVTHRKRQSWFESRRRNRLSCKDFF